MAALLEEEEDGSVLNEDVAKLKAAWVAESVCPELLQFQQELVDDMNQAVADQERVLATVDRSPQQVFSASLYEMDINRIKFGIAKYLRTRLVKIERYAWKFMSDPTFREKLSEAEISFAEKYTATMHQHLHESVLKHLPEEFQDFPDAPKSVAAADYYPSSDTYVFCRVRPGVDEQVQLDATSSHAQLSGGQTHVLRYPTVQALVGHQIDLI